ncbi:MAG: hypothetical protein JWQ16_1260 [Novosphingobium sp.]|nr:hypothetical protein [Novosphingobium sp.]
MSTAMSAALVLVLSAYAKHPVTWQETAFGLSTASQILLLEEVLQAVYNLTMPSY